MLPRKVEQQASQGYIRTKSGTSVSKNVLFRHPGSMLKSQFCTSYFFLAQVNMFPELSNCIQRSIMLKTEATDLGGKKKRQSKSKIVLGL